MRLARYNSKMDFSTPIIPQKNRTDECRAENAVHFTWMNYVIIVECVIGLFLKILIILSILKLGRMERKMDPRKTSTDDILRFQERRNGEFKAKPKKVAKMIKARTTILRQDRKLQPGSLYILFKSLGDITKNLSWVTSHTIRALGFTGWTYGRSRMGAWFWIDLSIDYFNTTSFFGQILSLCLLAYMRFNAVACPSTRGTDTRGDVFRKITVLWVISLLLGAYFEFQFFYLVHLVTGYQYLFQLLLTLLIYVFPMLFIIGCYRNIYRRIRSNGSRNNAVWFTGQQQVAGRSEYRTTAARRVWLMSIVVMLCYLPYYLWMLVTTVLSPVDGYYCHPTLDLIRQFVYPIAYSEFTIDSIVVLYCNVRNRRVVRGYMDRLASWCQRKSDEVIEHDRFMNRFWQNPNQYGT